MKYRLITLCLLAACGDKVDGGKPDSDCDVSWYPDEDGDGHGASGAPLEACLAPEGYVASADDCDDADASRFPSAEEVCNDGVVNDCDGSLDEAVETCTRRGTLTPADAILTLLGEEEQDRLGTSICPAGDINGDGLDDFLAGAYVHDGNRGEALLIYGSEVGDEGALSAESVSTLEITLGDLDEDDVDGKVYLGQNCVGGQDLTGDGVPDVVLGAHYFDEGRENQGMACVLSGAWLRDEGSSASLSALGGGSVCILGEGSSDFLSMLDGLRIDDFNGDGWADLALGAINGGTSGRMYVIEGPIAEDFAGLEEASVVVSGDGVHSYPARTLSSADLDGDGLPELLVGGGGSSGIGYALGLELYPQDPSQRLDARIELEFEGAVADDHFGRAGLTAGDLSGDGIPEVVVTAINGGNAQEGRVYIYDGAYLSGRTSGEPLLSSAATHVLEGASPDARAGLSPKILPDMNGDGIDELLIGNNNPGAGGQGQLIYGGGLYSGLLSDAELLFTDDGLDARYFARELSPIGDFNGDGVQDLAVGAHHWTEGSLTKRGAVFVYLGSGI